MIVKTAEVRQKHWTLLKTDRGRGQKSYDRTNGGRVKPKREKDAVVRARKEDTSAGKTAAMSSKLEKEGNTGSATHAPLRVASATREFVKSS